MLSVSLFRCCAGREVANYFTNRPYGSDPSEVKLIQMFAVDYDYLALYSPEMLCGRGFSEAYGNERNKVVLNEEAVRLFLEGRIPFLKIGELVEGVVDSEAFGGPYTLDDVYACDAAARAYVLAHVS